MIIILISVHYRLEETHVLSKVYYKKTQMYLSGLERYTL